MFILEQISFSDFLFIGMYNDNISPKFHVKYCHLENLIAEYPGGLVKITKVLETMNNA